MDAILKRAARIALLLFCALPASAAGSFVQYGVNVGSGTTVVAQFSINDAAGNMIWVLCTYKPAYGGVCNSVPTDSEGNTFVADGTAVASSSNDAGMIAYHAFNIAGGTKDSVTCHTNGGSNSYCTISEWHGLNALDKQNSGASETGTAAATSSVSTTVATETLLGGGGLNPGGGSHFSAAGSGYTSEAGCTTLVYCLEYQNVTSTGATPHRPRWPLRSRGPCGFQLFTRARPPVRRAWPCWEWAAAAEPARSCLNSAATRVFAGKRHG
jgi:hypothetical protein